MGTVTVANFNVVILSHGHTEPDSILLHSMASAVICSSFVLVLKVGFLRHWLYSGEHSCFPSS